MLGDDVEASFSDIWDSLDVGVIGYVEARRGKLNLTGNLVYTKLSQDGDGVVSVPLPMAPGADVDVDLETELLIAEARATWEVLSLPLFGEADERRVSLDVGPAFRAWWTRTDLDVKVEGPMGPVRQGFDESVRWIDFLAAARIRAELHERVTLYVSGDFGGFDVGSSAHRTWSLMGILGYRLGPRWDLVAGWRTLKVDRRETDAKMEGPILGVLIHF